MILAMVMIAGCLCGLNSPLLQDTGKGDYNVSPSGPDNPGNINSTEPVPPATPADTVMPTPSPTPRPSAFTISVEGGKDHQPGDTVRIYGVDTYSAVLYLLVSGTKTPISGGSLDNLQMSVVDGDADTFTRVNVNEDGSWEYNWTVPPGQPALMFDLYNVIASIEPRDKPHLDEATSWDMVTVKISPDLT
jgi:hypothetical protein